jgi:hypothetical protein
MSTESGKPEAQPRASFLQTAEADAKAVLIDIEEALKRALAGVEVWYRAHYHKAAVSGSQPIPADQKAALVEHVTAAINPVKE